MSDIPWKRKVNEGEGRGGGGEGEGRGRERGGVYTAVHTMSVFTHILYGIHLLLDSISEPPLDEQTGERREGGGEGGEI